MTILKVFLNLWDKPCVSINSYTICRCKRVYVYHLIVSHILLPNTRLICQHSVNRCVPFKVKKQMAVQTYHVKQIFFSLNVSSLLDKNWFEPVLLTCRRGSRTNVPERNTTTVGLCVGRIRKDVYRDDCWFSCLFILTMLYGFSLQWLRNGPRSVVVRFPTHFITVVLNFIL